MPAEQISLLFKERQRTSQETLEELKNLIDEINAARREQTERGMPVEVFSIFWLLKKEGIEQPEEKANQMRGILEQYPHWRKSESHEREVKRELYAVLVRSGIKDIRKITEYATNIMKVLKGAAA